MSQYVLGAFIASLCIVVTLLFATLRNARTELLRASRKLTRFNAITDLERHKAALGLEVAALKAEHQAATLEWTKEQERRASDELRRRETLEAEYASARSKHEEIQRDVLVYEERIEDMSFGVYKPHFSFGTSDEYRVALEAARAKAKIEVRIGKAVLCPKQWTVNNNKRQGERMLQLYSKLVLRAFNGECEAAIAVVSWNNVAKMEARVQKSYEAINKLGVVVDLAISEHYLELKLTEIRLTYEYETKIYEEREERRRIREQIREEQKAQREIEKAVQDAQSDEARLIALIAKAREEETTAIGVKLQKLGDQISRFEAKLDEARNKKQRAIARAQMTKSGFVYVISNIGSFGEQVFKIGMTRRLEPMNRIYELSGASVPFPYDLHAMLWSDDAPALEFALHKRFEPRRLNRVNPRREFFRDISWDEIEDFVKERGLSAQFIRTAEAREYRQTVSQISEARADLEKVADHSQKCCLLPNSLDATGKGLVHRHDEAPLLLR